MAELVDALCASETTQPVPAEITEADSVDGLAVEQLVGRARQEYLTAVRQGEEARAAIEIRSRIEPTIAQVCLAGVERHPDPKPGTGGPRRMKQRELGIPGCSRGIRSPGEYANRVAMRCSRSTIRDGRNREDLLVATQHLRWDLTRRRARSRRDIDVSEQEGDGSRRQRIGAVRRRDCPLDRDIPRRARGPCGLEPQAPDVATDLCGGSHHR